MKKIQQEVLTVLGSMEVEGNAARIYGGLTNGKLDPTLYKAVDKVLKALGGTWNRNHKFGQDKGAHVFASDPRDVIDTVLAVGGYVDAKAEFGAFYTPEPLAKCVVELAEFGPRMRWLEPSAGGGALVRAALAAGAQEQYATLVEIDANVGSSLSTCYTAHGALVHVGDFLEFTATEPYDRIVMNPTFVRQADLDHVRHAHRFLKPGGRLVAIMSAGVKFRENKKTAAFDKDILVPHMITMEDNPEGSFKVSGTGVHTVTVVLGK